MSDLFIKALKENNLDLMKTVPKSDLHNHSTRGANRTFFEKENGVQFAEVPKFKSIAEMDEWYNQNIDQYCCGRSGFIKRLINLFQQAKDENIVKFAPSFCLDMSKHFDNDIGKYIEFLKMIHSVYAPDIEFLPELSIKRTDDVELTEIQFREAMKFNFFKSIDLMGDEKLGTKMFVNLYKVARECGLILKAHVGEFESAEFIREAILDLNLDVINHGLSAADSKDLMDYIRDNKIIINVCPTSNVFLSRVSDYSDHPIKKFYEHGIICTVNTDDLLIFNQTISEEYFNLYNNGVLGAEELNEIRLNGLNNNFAKRRVR